MASGARCDTTVSSSIAAVEIHSAVRYVSRTRSGLRAPKFCPATGATPNASATIGMKPACTTRCPMPNPAWAEAPNGRMTW